MVTQEWPAPAFGQDARPQLKHSPLDGTPCMIPHVRTVSLATVLTLPVPLVAGCQGDATSSNSIPECAGTVSVSATAGTTPDFAWSPTCRLALLIVRDTLGNEQWHIVAPGNLISPPVRYGITPPSAVLFTPPQPLTSGGTYTVALWGANPNGPAGIPRGSTTFTP
jgi:hypothetical protein